MKTQSYVGVLLATLLLITGAAAAQVTVQKAHGGYSVRSVETLEVSPGGDLKIDDVVGDVRISSWSSSQVEVIQEFVFDVGSESEAREAFDHYQATVKKTGNRIEVLGQQGLGGSVTNLKKLLLGYHNSDFFNSSLEIHLPETFNLDAATTGGDVELLKLKGTAYLETAGGDIEANDVTGTLEARTSGGDVTARRVTGVTTLKTAGGDVSITDSQTGPFTLETSGGNIEILTLRGQVRAVTSGGDVDAREVKGDVDLRTSGGEITLQQVEGSEHSASTAGGDVEARQVVGNVELKTSGGSVSAAKVQGKVFGRTSGGDMDVVDITGDVDISTAGGDLDIRTVKGRLIGKTSGGDVRARVEQGGRLAGPIRLNTSGGEIELILPADVQASVSARIMIEDEFYSYDDYSIRSDFKLNLEERRDEKKKSRRAREIFGSGDLNGGGPLIELETINGDIIIVKGN